MLRIVEIAGRPHVLQQSDGKTFRIGSRESKVIDDSKISKDFMLAEERGLIYITSVQSAPTKKKEV